MTGSGRPRLDYHRDRPDHRWRGLHLRWLPSALPRKLSAEICHRERRLTAKPGAVVASRARARATASTAEVARPRNYRKKALTNSIAAMVAIAPPSHTEPMISHTYTLIRPRLVRSQKEGVGTVFRNLSNACVSSRSNLHSEKDVTKPDPCSINSLYLKLSRG
jgi:hypothetical protein